MFILKEYRPRNNSQSKDKYFHLLTKDNSRFSFIEKNVYTIFGIEKFYNNTTFKWVINEEQIKFLSDLENHILNTIKEFDVATFNDISLKNNNIIIKNNYPTMLNTFIKKKAHEIIEHDEGDILNNFSTIKKHQKYNVRVEINNLYVNLDKKELSYKYLVTKIMNP